MSFLFQKQDPLDLMPENGLSQPLGTFSENVSAAFDAARSNDQAYSEATVLRDQWGPIVDTINERAGMDAYSEFLGIKIRTFMHDGFSNPANNISSSILNAPATPGNAEQQYLREAQRIVDYLQENKDLFPDLQWVTHEEVLRRGMTQAQQNRETLQDLEGRSPGATNMIARFIGGLGGVATDPINVETAFIGGGARTLYGAIFREAALGAGVEGISQAGVMQWYEKLGYEYTPEQFWTAVAMGGAFGGAMPVVFRVGGKSISLTTDQLKSGYRALVDSGAFTPNSVTRTAERQAEILESENAVNPLADDAVHLERMEQATVAAEHGEPPAMSDTPPAAPKPASPELQRSYDAENANNANFDAVQAKIEALQAEQTQLDEALQDLDFAEAQDVANQQKARRIEIKDEIDALKEEQAAFGAENQRILTEREALVQRALVDGAGDNIDGLIYRFDPAEIQIDADTFQFKAGGDEFGVTERLQGVTQWDPIKAGQVTVFEYADGSRFIADGHQRVGLARRIQAQDPTQDVRLYGHLLRETDGITPEMARVIAAVKNIAEGTGTAIDAAKVLRVAPERVGELPPRSALVRQAQGLTLLSDEAFGAVINGVVPSNYAALVGRLIPEDEGLQSNAISVLAKTDPANEFQAEAIVRQVRDAGAERVTQDSLFGEEIITESYFTERARVLDRAQKQLRQDKAAFSTLVRNAERLEAEGNQLARNANQRRATNDTQAISLLQALANRKGPVSDALNAAARAARESGSYAEPTRNFVDAVRRAAESGDFDRISTGDVGQLIDAPTQSRTAKDVSERAVEDFDEPGGQGVRDQGDQLQGDIFGAADPEPQPVRETKIPDGQIVRLQDLDFAEAKAVELQAKANQAFVSVNDLMERAARNHDDLTVQIRAAAESVGAKQKVAPLKLRERVEEKIRDKYAGDLNRITDVARGGIEAETNEIADAFVAALSQRYKVIDEGYSFTAEGYFDRKLAVIFDDGQIGEIQIWPPGMLDAKGPKGGHDLYKVSRDLSQPEAARAKAVADMQQLYADVANNLSDSWKALLARQTPSGMDAPSRAVNEATMSRVTSGDPSSPSTSEALIGDQVPVVDKDTISPLDVSTAGMDPSTRKNLIGTSSDNIDIANQNVKLDLDEEIPVDLRVDPDTGDVIAQTVTLRQIQDDIAQDVKMLDRLRGCAK